MSYSPALNLPTAKRKGLIKLLGGLACPFYYTTEAVVEAQPMKISDAPVAAAVNEVQLMEPAGATEGAQVCGLAMQITYDDSAYGQLQGYFFANDTMQRLDGMPIGLLTGQGHAQIENYNGVVAANEQLAVGPSGLLVGATTSGAGEAALVRAWADTGGTAPAPIRVRYDFEHSAG